MSDKAYEIRHARGEVLANLNAYYPNGMTGRMIFETVIQPVFPGVEWQDVFAHLCYLAERGYIEQVGSAGPDNSQSPKAHVYRLTSKGIDVASGLVTDPTVRVGA